MSLTHHLNNTESLIFKWFNSKLNRATLDLAAHHNQIMSQKNIDPIPQGVNYLLLGTAVSYALRHQIQPLIDVMVQTPAYTGATILNSANKFTTILALCGKSHEEKALAYLLLASLESVACGNRPEDFVFFFFKNGCTLPINKFEEGKYAPTVEDLINLIESNQNMLETLDLKSKNAVLNPTFAGSSSLGGADAQLIVDGNLLDIRTTKSSKPFTVKNFWQQLAYVLLDWNDEYEIQTISWYYTRQKSYFSYEVNDMFTDLQSTREEFKEVCKQIDKEKHLFLDEKSRREAWPTILPY